MRSYRATIRADRYPLEFTVEASSWPTAVARAVRLWAKRFKGSRADELTIRIVRI
jgi:hypothetical protein